MKPIYLDYNASAPIALEVAAAIRPFLRQHYGNPSSHHWAGVLAKQALEKGRSQVAALLGCSPQEIIFTSGGTEANNHAIKGVFFWMRQKSGVIPLLFFVYPLSADTKRDSTPSSDRNFG